MAAERRSSLYELIKGRWREFIREPSAAFFVILMPIVFMTILGFSLDGDREEIYGVGWATDAPKAAGQDAQSLLTGLKQDRSLKLRLGTKGELAVAMQRGDVVLIVQALGDSVQFLYDPANRDARHAQLQVNDTIQRAAGRGDPLRVVSEKTRVPGTRYVDFLVPGLLAMSIMSTSLFGTGMIIVSNRRENLLKRYLATPMRPYEYILSHVIGRGFMLVVEAGALLVAAVVLFRFAIAGRALDFAVLAALGAAAFTALGVLLGSRTANVATMNGMTNLLTLPMLLVSGVWFSRTNFPDWLSEAVRWLPLTALVDGLRRIALEGAGLASLGFELGVLGVFFVACTAAATALFKWY
jgi:ABC-type multidrug transport system permease subunit